jgi:hypothetical protein
MLAEKHIFACTVFLTLYRAHNYFHFLYKIVTKWNLQLIKLLAFCREK